MKIESILSGGGWWLLAATAICLVGCTVHTEGIGDLIGDGFSYVGFPGHLVLTGGVSKYEIDERSDGTGAVVAIGLDGNLAIAPMLDGAPCIVGPATDFRISGVYVQGGSTQKRVPYLHDLDRSGWSTLSFVDHGCAQLVLGATGAEFLDIGPVRFEPPRFLAKSRLEPDAGDGSFGLLECDPVLNTQPCKNIATIRDIMFRNGWLWTLEKSEDDLRIVARDQSLTVSISAGSGVLQFAVGETGDWAAFTDSTGLHVANASSHEVVDVATDACQLDSVLSRSRTNGGFVYRSPCATGPLYVYDVVQAQAYQLAAGATLPIVLERSYNQSAYAYYLTSTATLTNEPATAFGRSLTGAFFAQFGRDAPLSVGTLAVTNLGGATVLGPRDTWLASVLWTYSTRVLLLSEFDGLYGKLMQWDFASGDVTDLATDVADFSYNWAIRRTEGGETSLEELINGEPASALVHRVLDRGVIHRDGCVVGSIDCATSALDPKAVYSQAVLSDVTTTGGTLWLLRSMSSGAPFESPEFFDDHVDPRNVQFLRGGDAVLYLRNIDQTNDAATLTARFVETLDAFTATGVTSWLEVAGNAPGILYSSVQGSRAGLLFAPLR